MEIPIRRGVSYTRKSDIMQMHFILTMHVKVEVVNIITYIAGFISIKMSLKILSHNCYNINTDVALILTMLTIKWLPFQLLTEHGEIWSLCTSCQLQIGTITKIHFIKHICL